MRRNWPITGLSGIHLPHSTDEKHHLWWCRPLRAYGEKVLPKLVWKWSENGAAPNSKKFLNCTKLHHSPWQVSRIGGRCQVNPTKTPALFPLVWAPKLPGAARSLMGESKNGLLTSSYSHLTRDIWVHLRKHCIPKVSQSDGGIQCGNWASAKHVIPATRG